MAIAIPEWVPKFIQQAVEYRERQKVTHERLNELFNLLITQGDWNTTTLETINDNLAAFDLQYLADFNENTTAHQNILANFTTAINTMDAQQRQLMAEMLVDFEAELTASEQRISADLVVKLAEIQALKDAMFAKEAEFDADMQTLTNTVENLRATILADNQAIAAQIQADRLAIEVAISNASGIMQSATQIIATQDVQAEQLTQITEEVEGLNKYVVTSGIWTALTAEVPGFDAYTPGAYINIIAHSNNPGAAVTMKVNDLAAIPIFKQGSTTTPPNIVAGKPYTLIVNQDGASFFLKASAEGTAVAEHVLAGDTFSNNADIGIEGTMPNIGAVNQSLALNASYSIPEGYHNGLGQVTQSLPASVVNTADANATAAKILTGSNAYVNGAKVNGSMPDYSGQDTTPNSTNPQVGGLYVQPKAGYYNQVGAILVSDPDFIAANIPSDMNFFGLQGTRALGKKFASGNATASAAANKSWQQLASDWVNRPYIIVSGLTFKPRIILMQASTSDSVLYTTLYFQDGLLIHDGYSYVLCGNSSRYGTNSQDVLRGNTGDGYVNTAGFCLPVAFAAPGVTFGWYAWE